MKHMLPFAKTKALLFLLFFVICFTKSQIIYSVTQSKYLPCTRISHVIPMLNNNSISTAISDQRNMYLAVTARNALIYKISFNITEQSNIKITDLPFQTLKDCSQTSAIALTNDGQYLAVGCGNSNINIYTFDGKIYILKQTLKDSYYKNGAKILFSSDGHLLFSVQSPKTINIYTIVANLYQLIQQIPINMQTTTLLSLSPNTKYFTTIQLNTTNFYLTLYKYEQSSKKYVQSDKKLITQIINSISINNNYVTVVIGTLINNCVTQIYKIANNGNNLQLIQQIFQDQKRCIVSCYLNYRGQLILTNTYFTSVVYKDKNGEGFLKMYELYHEAQGAPIHTQVRLIDTKFQHLVIYTGFQINFYCPGVEYQQLIDQ